MKVACEKGGVRKDDPQCPLWEHRLSKLHNTMPTGIEEAIGLGIGVAGILAGFAGAVDGYRLLYEIFSKDNGLRALAADWHVENVRFKTWGERFRVDEGVDCLLHAESQLVRGAIAMVIAEILTLQLDITPKLEKYGIADLQAPTKVKPSEESFQSSSKWIERLRQQRANIKQVRTFVWAVQDKDKLQEIVNQLARRNDQLWKLVKSCPADRIRRSTALLEDQEDEIARSAALNEASARPDSLLAVGLHLKQIREADTTPSGLQAPRLTGQLIMVKDNQATEASCLALGIYTAENGEEREIFVEWKDVEASGIVKDMIIERIRALGALLSTRNAVEFRRPTCLGTFEDKKYQERTRRSRIGLVYQLPPKAVGLPVSLSSLLLYGKKNSFRPPLGQRFMLAFRLAAAISLFHASDWLHKAFRSDKILFATADDITEPLIAGFQYSRPVGDASLEGSLTGRPETDLYYHPSVNAGWTKIFDIYSLGVVLWEIAFWRPIFDEHIGGKNPRQVMNLLREELRGDSGKTWDGLVGEVYMNVVRRCLNCDFGVETGNDKWESKLLGKRFFDKVVKELERCAA